VLSSRLVRKVLDVVKDGLVDLEKLSKRFQDRIDEKSKMLNGIDVRRLKRTNMWGIREMLTEKPAKHGVP